jgi:hypothetical protein
MRSPGTSLPLEPDGLEGLLHLLIEADTADLTTANREHHRASSENLDAFAAPDTPYVRNNDRLTSVP